MTEILKVNNDRDVLLVSYSAPSLLKWIMYYIQDATDKSNPGKMEIINWSFYKCISNRLFYLKFIVKQTILEYDKVGTWMD